ncbi:hypothetical protein GGR28_000758 [Lewinella aquimaris]|uniref:DUF3098 domain-containing protein n=1 Tax=Neolewinella aquimaris TaxID=1835722 RepID=A0A840E4V6_9BACT|nr:DUF3098 domain-containing protein [Neolewinella aquimaris]MBB4078157.1 hypothetical protein [Neolewinella aquimaris]
MSKRNKQKNRSGTVAEPAAEPVRIVATPKVKDSRAAPDRAVRPLVFGSETYKWLGIGFLLVVVGFLLMIGGRDADPSVFDAEAIYSFRRITLAPLIILAGLGVTTYAIFKK